MDNNIIKVENISFSYSEESDSDKEREIPALRVLSQLRELLNWV